MKHHFDFKGRLKQYKELQ